jgi:quinohemoprotein amine dehydrogenase
MSLLRASFVTTCIILALGLALTAQDAPRPAVGRGGGDAAARPGGEGGPGRRREGEEAEAEKKPRPGIPVEDPLVVKHCASCHKAAEPTPGEPTKPGSLLTRISYLRKAPEGWEITLKRMIRHHDLSIEPADAKALLSSLANSHGLTREEAKRALYEAERRVHWSESEADQDLRQTCAPCHTLGRVLSQQRDEQEWKLLKATHLAFFPLADWQAFRGRESTGGDGFRFDEASEAEIEAEMTRRRESRRGSDRADKVLGELAKKAPLFTDSWKEWQVQKREVPVAGTWVVVGHEMGRGAVQGEVVITKNGENSFQTQWTLRYLGVDPAPYPVASVTRTGKSVLYAGYSWRGRSDVDAAQFPAEPKQLKEVLLLSEDWNQFEGRIFFGDWSELGMDVTLHRKREAAAIHDVTNGALMVPGLGQELSVFGQNFPEGMTPEDWFLGAGVTVKAVTRLDASHVNLTVDVARGADQGRRALSFRSHLGPKNVLLYDTVDYLKIYPEEGFSRVGGTQRPKQLERFEAYAMNRGPDDKPYTADDFKVKQVPVTWGLEEFSVRENDDDLQYVGTLDPVTALFTPNIEGPNPARRWQANNIGDVYVTASCELHVQILPPKPKPPPPPEPAPKKDGEEGRTPPPSPPETPAATPPAPGEVAPPAVTPPAATETAPPPEKAATPPVVAAAPPIDPNAPPVMEKKLFRARGHLLVTVPLYVRWDQYDWDRR